MLKHFCTPKNGAYVYVCVIAIVLQIIAVYWWCWCFLFYFVLGAMVSEFAFCVFGDLSLNYLTVRSYYKGADNKYIRSKTVQHKESEL